MEGSQLEELREELARCAATIRALRARQQELLDLFENANDIVYTHDFSGQVTSFNRAAAAAFELDEDADASALHIRDLVDPSYLERAVASIQQKVAGSERTAPYELLCRTMTGKPMWLEVSSRVILGEDDQPVGIQGIARNVSERKHNEELIRHQALHDQLTGLPNRRLFEDRLRIAVAGAQRRSHHVAVLFVDLDRFKTINDGLGHHVGDAVITAVADRLRDTIRDTDTASRHSGDEFTIVLPALDEPSAAATFARRLLDRFREPLLVEEAGTAHTVYVTPSIGIALYPDDGSTNDDLIKFADLAMYRAKGEGGNQFAYYKSELNDLALRRLEVESRLRKLVADEAFTLCVRKRPRLDGNGAEDLEATLRVSQVNELGLSDGQFEELAEDTGLILRAGAWLLDAALRKGVEWIESGTLDGKLAIGISARQFLHGHLVRELQSVLRSTGFPADRLILQVTEGCGLGQDSKTIGILRALSELGVELALRRFGFAHCSLLHLRDAPIRSILVDSVFTESLPEDERNAAIVQSVITMCNGLDIDVVATGVSTESQREWLRAAGCTRIQGPILGGCLDATSV